MKVKYYFGRLNIMAEYSDKKTYLLKAFQADKFLPSRSNWGFLEIEQINDSLAGTFIHGYLVKYKKENLEEVVNEVDKEIREELIRNQIIAKSRFFLHVKSGVIAYHPIGNSISPNIFRSIFKNLFEYSLDNLFVNVDIQSIQDDLGIFEALQKFRRILKVEIILHPSNPSTRDLWEDTDNRLKEIEAKYYREYYEAEEKRGSLKIKDDPHIRSKITMAADGYGRAEVRGIDDNGEKTISTSDNPVNARVDDSDGNVNATFFSLQATFRKIFERFNY